MNKGLNFKYFMPTQLVLENGAIKQLSTLVKGKKVLIVCDPFIYQSGLAQKVADKIGTDEVAFFSKIEPNPSCDTVDNATVMGREMKADVVIGIGGGSSMDTSKMVSCLVDDIGSIHDYYSGGTREITGRKTQLICIPTTAGTGSEVTNIGVYTNKEKGIKMPFASPYFWPDIALIDPELTYTLPAGFTASTGMDAFCHAIESYWNINANPISDALAVSAMELILNNIKKAYDHPKDIEARQNMSLASMMAGVAFSQTKTTGIHALSFPLTTDFGQSHGVACAITLPAFIKLSYEGAKDKLDVLIKRFNYKDINDFSNSIESLMNDMGVPTRLSQIGVKESDLDRITDIGMMAPLIDFTPANMTKEVVHHLLKSIL